MTPTAANDNQAISHADKYEAFLKDLDVLYPVGPTFYNPTPTDVGLGFTSNSTDPHPYRQQKPPVRDAEGIWVSAPRAVDTSESITVDKPWFQNKRPRLATHTPSKSTPEERAAGRSRYAAAHGKGGEETKAIAKLRRAMERRQGIGDPNCPPHRGHDVPLLTVLKKDGHTEYTSLVLAYRKLAALALVQPLQSNIYGGYSAGMAVKVQMRSKRLTPEKDIEKAAASNWAEIPDGEIKYKNEVVRLKRPLDGNTGKRVAAISPDDDIDDGFQGKDELHVNFSESGLIDQIDAKRTLAKLRAALGPLLSPFEDAVLGGMNLSQIGKREGFTIKPDLVGKALCLRALASHRWAWHDLETLDRLYSADNDNDPEEVALVA